MQTAGSTDVTDYLSTDISDQLTDKLISRLGHETPQTEQPCSGDDFVTSYSSCHACGDSESTQVFGILGIYCAHPLLSVPSSTSTLSDTTRSLKPQNSTPSDLMPCGLKLRLCDIGSETCVFSSVQFNTINYALHLPVGSVLSVTTENRSSAFLIEDGPFSSFQNRSNGVFNAVLLQSDRLLDSFAFCLYEVSQAPQQFKSSKRSSLILAGSCRQSFRAICTFLYC